jgi:hypothetical protein
VLFNPIDKKTLYYAGNVLFKTMSGGNSWQIISPDLSRESWDIPSSVGIYTNDNLKTMPRRGVIYTVAPSYKDINTIWCGTDDGLIHITRDGGKTWRNVTPPEITSWSKISLMDASHFDVNTVYAAVNRIRCDDMHPHIYKTNDGGKNWKEIVNGLPNDPINVVREDPKRKGLLFAGSERAVYVSFDDGEHWQSLRLNMPCTSIRDLVIKDDDLVIGTHGRSFWILDDITPLRQLNSKLINASVILFKPQTAYRVRWNMNTDTPLPQEEPAGQNPPDGAIINYYLAENQKEVSLEIRDAKNNLIRSYSNLDTLYTIPANNVPPYWIRPQLILLAKAGSHRFTWDLHYDPLNEPASYPIGATYMNTAPNPTSPWVMPGIYTVKLTADGKMFSQNITVKMDPRVSTSFVDLQKQHDLSLQCYLGKKQCKSIIEEINILKLKLNSNNSSSKELDQQLSHLANASPGYTNPNFTKLINSYSTILNTLEECDRAPTHQTITALNNVNRELKELMKQWKSIKDKTVLNPPAKN